MSSRSIKFHYKAGAVIGGYSFSAYDNIITLPRYVEKLDNAKIREAIQYEAKTARSFYIEEVNRLKANGEKINSFLVKREATRKAKDKAQAKYAEIWSEVEDIYKTPPPLSVAPAKTTSNRNKFNITNIKDIGFFIAVVGSDNLLDKLIETIEAHNEAIGKAVDSP